MIYNDVGLSSNEWWMGVYSDILFVFVYMIIELLPFLALMSILSLLASSPWRGILWATFVVLLLPRLLLWLGDSFALFSYLTILLPGVVLEGVWAPLAESGSTVQTIIALLQCAVYLLVGRLIMWRIAL